MRYTDEMNSFLREFIPGHSEREIAKAFKERFGIELTRSQVKTLKTRLGVKSVTVGGRFERGHVRANNVRSWE